jgi:hypothetical protein
LPEPARLSGNTALGGRIRSSRPAHSGGIFFEKAKRKTMM